MQKHPENRMICGRAGSDHKKGVPVGNKFWTFCYAPLPRTQIVGWEIFGIRSASKSHRPIKLVMRSVGQLGEARKRAYAESHEPV
jgi:hypothetical protein